MSLGPDRVRIGAQPGITLSPRSLRSPLTYSLALQACVRLSSASARSSCPQLQEVVGGTDECPLPADLAVPAQQELAEPPALFDLPEHRLDGFLPHGVQPPPPLRAQRGAHAVRHRECLRDPAAGRGRARLPVVLTIGRDQGRAARLSETLFHRRRRDETLRDVWDRDVLVHDHGGCCPCAAASPKPDGTRHDADGRHGGADGRHDGADGGDDALWPNDA